MVRPARARRRASEVALRHDGGGGQSGDATPLCGRTGIVPGPGDPFLQLKYAMAARWAGNATTPTGWVQPIPYPVEIVFEPDGSYSAQCTLPECVAFYYGMDEDDPQKLS